MMVVLVLVMMRKIELVTAYHNSVKYCLKMKLHRARAHVCACVLRLTLVKMKICLCVLHTLCTNVLYALWPSLAVWYNIHFDRLFTITMWRFDRPIFDVNTRLFCGTKTFMWLNVRNVCSTNLVCYECIDGDWTLRTIDFYTYTFITYIWFCIFLRQPTILIAEI